MKVKRIPGEGKAILEKIIVEGKDTQGKVGFFESAKYENGTPVAQVAVTQEFGDPEKNIPPRPFFRNAIAENQTAWKALVSKLIRAVVKGKITYHEAIEMIGLTAAGHVRKSISVLTAPALAESTIRARLRKRADGKTIGLLTKPLVDSKIMINSVTNLTEKKTNVNTGK